MRSFICLISFKNRSIFTPDQTRVWLVWLYFLGRYEKCFMNNERKPAAEQQEENSREENNSKPPRSSAFKEPVNKDRKQTSNPEEEANLEQERKDAMTERD
jgi:hypothetical protein